MESQRVEAVLCAASRRRLPFVAGTRGHRTSMGVVSFSILRSFESRCGPKRFIEGPETFSGGAESRRYFKTRRSRTCRAQVLEKNTYIESGQKLIKLGDKSVAWDDSFRLFFTTKLGNPHYSPEVMAKTMLINYSVTQVRISAS